MNIDRTLRNRLLTVVPVAALAFSLTACAGPVERPTPEEVAVGYQKILDDASQGDAYSADLVQCVSEALVDSDVSDQDLANIADGKDEQTSVDAQKLLTQVILDAAQDCATTE